MYTIEQIDEMMKATRRNCGLCPLSHIMGQASCKYRNAPDDGMQPHAMQFGEKRKAVPCLKFYIQKGLHGWIDPISGEPVIITAQAARAILEALDKEEAEE